jgi:hypothetical protein
VRSDFPKNHIVIVDPLNEYWEGAIIETELAMALRGRGVVTLPIAAELVTRSAVGGYFKRGWGAGWPLSSPVPRMVCPMVLYVVRDDGFRNLNWVARLVPESEDMLRALRNGDTKLSGTIRLAGDSGQPGASSGGFGGRPDTCVEMNKLQAMDAEGGWTLYGGGTINPLRDGMFACALYGNVIGTRIAWSAVTQSK